MTVSEQTQRIWIEAGCIACGLCESLVPEAFRVPSGATSEVVQGWRAWADTCAESEERLRGARDSCPVDVIRLAP